MSATDEAVEELEALSAIYGDDCEVDVDHRTLQVFLPCKDSCPRLVLRAHLPESYPGSSTPVLELQAPHLSDDRAAWAASHVDDMFVPGEVVMYSYIEWLKEQVDLYTIGGSAPEEQQRDDGSDSEQPGLEEEWEEGSFEGPPDSVPEGQPGQAHVAPVSSLEEVKAVVAALLRVNKIANATHNIMAYRIYVPDKQSYLQDSDDDGEAAAGGRLLHLLQAADVRNVVVVVSRWFGGVLLGPSRFALINNTARQLLEEHGHIVHKASVAAKKPSSSKASRKH